MKLPQDFREFFKLFNAKGVNKKASSRAKDVADIEALGECPLSGYGRPCGAPLPHH